MRKYGLQLRVPPQNQKKDLSKSLHLADIGFCDDEEEDVGKEILLQGQMKASLKGVEEQHKRALEDDPSLFDYDGIYDSMKRAIAQPRLKDQIDRKPKYISTLVKKAKEREKRNEIRYEAKLVKERSIDDHLYAEKGKFVTAAYKKKLAEQAKWMDEERLCQLREEKEEVTKKSNLSEFYFNIGKNVAFGGRPLKEQHKHEDQRKSSVAEEVLANVPIAAMDTSLDSHSLIELDSGNKFDVTERSYESVSDKTCAHPSLDMPSGSLDMPSESDHFHKESDHHKRNDLAIIAAKERFLARKRLKEQ